MATWEIGPNLAATAPRNSERRSRGTLRHRGRWPDSLARLASSTTGNVSFCQRDVLGSLNPTSPVPLGHRRDALKNPAAKPHSFDAINDTASRWHVPLLAWAPGSFFALLFLTKSNLPPSQSHRFCTTLAKMVAAKCDAQWPTVFCRRRGLSLAVSTIHWLLFPAIDRPGKSRHASNGSSRTATA